jgi:hypothetical protein
MIVAFSEITRRDAGTAAWGKASGCRRFERMQGQLGPLVFAAISCGFAAYGLRELRAAYFTAAVDQWRHRALFGAASVMLAGLFADLAYHTIA